MTLSITPQNILIIKQGAFGDIIKSFKAFEVVRASFSQAKITLLTTPPFKEFCQQTPYFDSVMTDLRPKNPLKTVLLLEQLLKHQFDLVIDLQGSNRTARYATYMNFRRKTPWLGNAAGCQFYQPKDFKQTQHPFVRQSDLLARIGVNVKPEAFAVPDLQWIKADINRFNLPARYAVLIPGSSPHTLAKRWPAKFYGQVAWQLDSLGMSSVIIGGQQDRRLAEQIASVCSTVIDLTGQTSFTEIYPIAQKAGLILGNDTGPLFLAATSGRPTLVLWSDYCKRDLNAPWGDHIELIEETHLSHLSSDRVWHRVSQVLAHPQHAHPHLID
jgi:ADP-heptose:LPS heptosyltransferase